MTPSAHCRDLAKTRIKIYVENWHGHFQPWHWSHHFIFRLLIRLVLKLGYSEKAVNTMARSSATMLLSTVEYIDGLVQEIRNSIANAMELRLSCTNPSVWDTRVLVFHKDAFQLNWKPRFLKMPNLLYCHNDNLWFRHLASRRLSVFSAPAQSQWWELIENADVILYFPNKFCTARFLVEQRQFSTGSFLSALGTAMYDVPPKCRYACLMQYRPINGNSASSPEL